MFGPKLLAQVNSRYSGKLEVHQIWRDKYVSTGFWTQSGGLIQEVWRPVFKKLKVSKDSTWLVLGLATGSVCRLIPQPKKIVGVEIDPVMLDIGRKYFDLHTINNLQILNIDAKNFLARNKFQFDYVLVDLYLGDQIPKFVYTTNFPGRVVIINHLFYSPIQQQTALNFVAQLQHRFPSVTTIRSLTNLLIVCKQ